MKRALIVVDVQNDFMPDGALPVPGGDEVIAPINALMSKFELVVATQDWHPANHGSFAANHDEKEPGETIELDGIEQMLWPVHCVQNSTGAAFVEGLLMNRFDEVFVKGTDPNVDSYSGFFDNRRGAQTGLDAFLRAASVTDIFVCGVATEYCVRHTAADGAELGYRTHLVVDACRGVNAQRGEEEQALRWLAQCGVELVESKDVGDDEE